MNKLVSAVIFTLGTAVTASAIAAPRRSNATSWL
jgi:hypothetical protein